MKYSIILLIASMSTTAPVLSARLRCLSPRRRRVLLLLSLAAKTLVCKRGIRAINHTSSQLHRYKSLASTASAAISHSQRQSLLAEALTVRLLTILETPR